MQKKCNDTYIEQQNDHKHHSSAGTFYTSSAGTIVALILLFLFSFYLSGINVNDTHATASTLSLSIDNTTAGLDISSVSNDGTFAKSSVSTITVSTNNSTGYTLSIAASSSTNYDKLMLQDQSAYIGSIESRTTENDFSSSSQNNVWGYIPSKYDSVDNTSTKYYYPAPNTDGDILANTNCANGVSDCPNEDTYTIGFGVRVDASTKIGTYSNTYIVQLVADAVPYSISYVDNVVGNMPVDEAGTTDGETVNVSGTIPTRTDYTFLGWCSVPPTTNGGVDTCSGTIYNPNGSGTDRAITIDRTGGSNAFQVYAMWRGNYVIGSLTYMQDFSTLSPTNKDKVISSMEVGQQYRLKDNRDNKDYWIAKQADGKIWMTQNLDLCIGCSGVAALNSNNTDLNTSGSGAYSAGYSTSGGVITWSPASTAITSSRTIGSTSGSTTTNWTDSIAAPYSVEGGEIYIYTSGTTDADTISTSCNTNDDVCRHYHRGNFYNYTASIASNNSSSIATQYYAAENSICPKGWRLPMAQANPVSNSNTREFGYLMQQSGITNAIDASSYASDGLNNVRISPLYFVRSGYINSGTLNNSRIYSAYWSSTTVDNAESYQLRFSNVYIDTAPSNGDRYSGISVRCLLR